MLLLIIFMASFSSTEALRSAGDVLCMSVPPFWIGELCQDCIWYIKVCRVTVQLQSVHEKEPRLTDRAASSLVKLFTSLVIALVNDMNTFEKAVDALKKDDELEDELVNEVQLGVAIYEEKLKNGKIVYHRAAFARVAKKNIKPCKTCCYVLHCQVTEHRHKVVPVVANHYSYGKDNLFDNMLDRSWLGLDECEDEMCILVNKDHIIFLICSVTLDLVD